MKNKEALIKKIKHGLKVATATALIALSLTSCANVETSFASQEEVSYSAELLECDTSYLMKQNGDFLRMKHNNGDPIYVCFDESYSEDLKTKATEALDYVFGIVGKINNKYHYEIVDKITFDLKINKTKIYYTFGNEVKDKLGNDREVNGFAENHSAWYNNFTDNPVMNYYEINVDSSLSIDKVLGTFIHEDLHTFGLDDVYTIQAIKKTNKYYGNTYMNVGANFEMITPNDLGCLISLYSDDNTDMVKMKQELKKYENKFYNYYANLCKERYKTTEDVVDENFSWFGGIIRTNEDGSTVGSNYTLRVENGRYLLKIIDVNTNEVVESFSGEATLQNGVMILKNVELKSGLYPYDEQACYKGGYIQDLAVITKDGTTSLYDFASNNFFYGGYISLEKGLTN